VAYFVQPVDREHMPEGHDWVFFQWPNGDATFILARDAGAVELSADVIAAIVTSVGRATGLPIRVERQVS
jgi:hypothetical protein